LESEVGQTFWKNQLAVAQQILPPMVDNVFSNLEATFDQLVNNVVASMGVLCLSEDALNQQMWTHYADQGKGFVVGFNARHPFFIHLDGSTQRNLLKKVIYTDEHTQNFWRNPYHLFLVKASGWAYEREWRMFKTFEDSDEMVAAETQQVHLWNLAPDAISTVHFGYQYDDNQMTADMARLVATGTRPAFYKLVVNRTSGVLEEKPAN
jgi:hypothetical protein